MKYLALILVFILSACDDAPIEAYIDAKQQCEKAGLAVLVTETGRLCCSHPYIYSCIVKPKEFAK